jgi:hypothetical protein
MTTKRRQIDYIDDNNYVEKWYNGTNELHSFDDNPAETKYENGIKVSERWFYKGHPFRDGNKPILVFYDKGVIIFRCYKIDTPINNPDNIPSFERLDASGNVTSSITTYYHPCVTKVIASLTSERGENFYIYDNTTYVYDGK